MFWEDSKYPLEVSRKKFHRLQTSLVKGDSNQRVLILPYFHTAEMSTNEFLGVCYSQGHGSPEQEARGTGTEGSGECSQALPRGSWVRQPGKWTSQQWREEVRSWSLRWRTRKLKTANEKDRWHDQMENQIEKENHFLFMIKHLW